ncbi:hypothetical protein G6F56_002950 [Rhizopus delemar]|nr:hypothetical protein G6F56_002950 [Rhizopus delemar]
MSHEELTSKIADSFQEFSSMLSQLSSNKSPINSPPVLHHTPIQQVFQTLPLPSPFSTNDHESEEESSDEEDYSVLLETTNVGTRLRSEKCISIVICAGKIEVLQEMIQLGLDLNHVDDKKSGLTPIMYAAYLGRIDCLKLLLQQPSLQVNRQDKKGWTALLWGINGCQIECVKLLLKYGAEIKMDCSRLFQYPTCTIIKELFGQKYDLSDKEYFPIENEMIFKSNLFNWNRCLPDQMFVFTQDQIPIIMDSVFSLSPDSIQLLQYQDELSSELWAPANIVFLCARFAHYEFSRELLNSLFDSVMVRLTKLIKSTSRDKHCLAFWIANICQLINYLKKDNGLSVVTLDIQESLSQSIAEAYTFFVIDTQRTLQRDLEPSLMEHDPIDEPIEFTDDWRFFFTRSSSDTLSCPQVITESLSKTLQILQSYHVPPPIVIQGVAQFFYYLSSELFNRVLSQKKYLCRSKALQIRLNLSTLEEWLRMEQLPSSLNRAFEPLMQLLQLLQCLSQMNDIATFSSTVRGFDRLNALQVKRCVQGYRYELSEAKLPVHIESLALQMAASKQSTERKSLNFNDSKRSSISSLNSLIGPKSKRMSTPELFEKLEDEEDDEEEEGEKKNTKYLLPFSVFNTTSLLQDWTEEKQKRSITNRDDFADTIYREIKLRKLEEYDLLDKIIPCIPYEWLFYLNKKLRV